MERRDQNCMPWLDRGYFKSSVFLYVSSLRREPIGAFGEGGVRNTGFGSENKRDSILSHKIDPLGTCAE